MVQGSAGEIDAFTGKIKPIISNEYLDSVAPLLRAAKTSIEVVMYQWGWYSYRSSARIQRLNYEYLSAARRGVKVRVLLNTDRVGGNLSRINNYTANQLRRAGAAVKIDTTGQLVHSKIVIIDDEIVVVGSHNYSERSLSSNIETSVIIQEKLTASKYKSLFELLYNR